jgi:O-antigen ligase
LLFGLMFLSVLWAFTRISMAGLVVAVAFLVSLSARSTVLKVMIPVALCVVFVSLFFTIDLLKLRMFKSREVSFSSIARSNPEQIGDMLLTSGRTMLWKQAGEKLFSKSPVIGKGLGSVDSWLETRSPPTRLHSEYLRLLCDLGIVGLSLYAAAILHFFLRIHQVWRSAENAQVRIFSATAMAALFFYVVTLATDNSFNYVTEFGLYVFAFAAFPFVAARHFHSPAVAGAEVGSH